MMRAPQRSHEGADASALSRFRLPFLCRDDRAGPFDGRILFVAIRVSQKTRLFMGMNVGLEWLLTTHSRGVGGWRQSGK
jgi:hypothetical protein